MTTNQARMVLALLPALLLAGLAAGAEEVRWRPSYAHARQEASQTGKPLLIEFTTARCFWCRKLENSTLREPRIAQMLNREFIPLRVDASRDTELAAALHIQSYPTVVLADADGTILQVVEGYRDGPRFEVHLQRVLAQRRDPDLQQAYHQATTALAAADYPRAIPLLYQVTQARTHHPVQARARQLLEGLEQQATTRLTHAARLRASGEVVQASGILTEVIRTYPGTRAAEHAGHLLLQCGGQ